MDLTLEELEVFARAFVAHLPDTLTPRAHVIGVSGELGAGKTTFVQTVARALGVTELLQSPTFVIAKTYSLAHPLYRRLVHVDAYRLSPSDPDTIGFASVLADPANLVLVEWPERLNGFPSDAPVLRMSHVDQDRRSVTYDQT